MLMKETKAELLAKQFPEEADDCLQMNLMMGSCFLSDELWFFRQNVANWNWQILKSFFKEQHLDKKRTMVTRDQSRS